MKLELPHLETNVTSVCNLSCVACNHFVPMLHGKPEYANVDVVARDLEIFSKLVHVPRFGMLGGEPTLHRELPRLNDIASFSGIADAIEVWTNGLTARRLHAEFWRSSFDVLVLSAYPGKLTDGDIEWISKKCADEGKLFELKDERKFPNFTQLLDMRNTDAVSSARRYQQCWFKTFSRVLDDGHFYRCCTSPYIPRLLLGLPANEDGLRVDEHLTVDEIISFLNQDSTPASCSVCAGRNTESSRAIPWSEIRDVAKWKDASAGEVHA